MTDEKEDNMNDLLTKQPLEYKEFVKYYLDVVKLSPIHTKDIERAYNSYINKYYSGYSSKLRELV